MALTAKKVYAILKRQISDMESKLNSPVRYRGTVATADLLPLNPDIGDMYNIESKSIYGEAGMNVAWNGVVWDTMGAPIDMSLYLTKEEAETVMQRLVTEYFEKNPVKPGATTEQAQQIEQNKTDIASLKTETGSLKEDLVNYTGNIEIAKTHGFYIFTNKNIGEVIDVTNKFAYEGFTCAVVPVVKGDLFIINAKGGSSPRTLAFTDSEYKLTFVSSDGIKLENFVVKAPNDGYMIINDATDSTSYYGRFLNDSVNMVDTMVSNGIIERIEFSTLGKYLDTSVNKVNINNVVTTSDTFRYSVTACEENDIFVVSGKGGNAPRLWAFTDENYNVLQRAEVGGYDSKKIVAPYKSAHLIVNTIASYEDCYKVISTKNVYQKLYITENDKYIRTGIGENGTQIEVLKEVNMTPVNFVGMYYINTPCKAGDVFIINGKGGGYGRLWAFLNANNELLDSSITSVDGYNIRIVAPLGSAKLIINTSTPDRISYKITEPIKKPNIPLVTAPIPTKLYNYDGDLKAISNDETEIVLSEDLINSWGDDRVTKMYEFYDKLVSLYPRYIRKEVLGTDTTNTHEIRCYTVSAFHDTNAPKVLLLSNIHGGEIPPELSTYFIAKELIENRNDDNMLGYIFRNSQVKIIPFANPYGVAVNNGINSNNVNLNRNFDGDWNPTVNPNFTVGTSGNAPFDQKETQIIRDFIVNNNDAIFTINQHTSSRISEIDEIAYFVDNFVTDRKVMQGLFNALDYNLKETYSWIKSVDKYNYKNMIRINDTEIHGGTMNKWFNAIGMRGCLVEISKGAGNNYDDEHSNDSIKIFIDIVTNLIGYMVGSIEYRFSDDTQTNHIKQLN